MSNKLSVDPAPRPWLRRLILVLVTLLFVVPPLSMLRFTFQQSTTGGWTGKHWADLFDPAKEMTYAVVFDGLKSSLLMAALTLVLVLVVFFPTIVLVHLRFPKLQRALDLLTILPIAIPAIVLVVGFAPVFRFISLWVMEGDWTLFLAYGVLVLPFAYRAIVSDLNGVDARTLSEAARSLGSNSFTVLVKVIAPNVRRGLLGASLLTIAIVLGEYTVSSLLNRVTFQVGIFQVSQSDGYAAVIMSLLSLAVMFVLLALVAAFGGGRRRSSSARRRPAGAGDGGGLGAGAVGAGAGVAGANAAPAVPSAAATANAAAAPAGRHSAPAPQTSSRKDTPDA